MYDRRKFVKSAALGTVALAGCSGNTGSESTDESGGESSGGSTTTSSDGGQKEATLSVAPSDFSPEHTQSQIIKQWNDRLNEETGGRLSVEYTSIGGEAEGIDATSAGSIDAHAASLTSLTQSFGQEFGFLEAPMVAQSWDHFNAMADKWIYGDGGFNENLVEQGNQRIIGSSYRGFRGTTSNMPVKKPADIEGVKMRLPEFETWVKTWEAIGVNATAVASDELYQSLETGVVNASEGPIQQFVDYSLYEVQTHFSRTDHLLQTFNWVINEDVWQSFSSEDQQILRETLDGAIKWANEKTRSETDNLLKMVQEEHDVTVIPQEEIDRESFASTVESQVKTFFKDRWKPSYDEVMDLAE